MTTASEFDPVIERYHAALLEFFRGDSQPAADLYSELEDATLANPFGGVVRGRVDVTDRMAKAAENYQDGDVVSFETFASSVLGDVAYLVEIERYRVRVAGNESPEDVALRVTTIFRREAGDWKIVHRQADTRVGPQAPESVVGPVQS